MATIHLISSTFNIQYRTENDFMNWAAVVIEIGVAAFISGVVLLYDRKHKRESRIQQEKMSKLLQETKNQQDEITKLLKRIEDIEINQQEFIENEKQFKESNRGVSINRLRSDLSNLHTMINALSQTNDENFNQHNVKVIFEIKDKALEQLEQSVSQSINLIEQRYLDRLSSIIRLARNNPKIITVEGKEKLEKANCVGILYEIVELLKELPNTPI